MTGSRDVSLTIFITSVSGSKGLASFAYRFFHFRRSPGLGLAFDEAEEWQIWPHSVPESKEGSSRGKKKRLVFLCRRTMRVAVKDKVIPTRFLKTEGRGTFVGMEERKRGKVCRISR